MSEPAVRDDEEKAEGRPECPVNADEDVAPESTTAPTEPPTSPANGSVASASDLHSVKSPDFDEHELEDVVLNDRSGDISDDAERETYSSLPRFTYDTNEPATAATTTEKEDVSEPEEKIASPAPEPPQGKLGDEMQPEPQTEPTIEPNELETVATDEKPAAETPEDPVPVQLERTTVIHSVDETPEDTFKRLKDGILNNTFSQKDVVDGLFNVLVGGPFDMESRFIIEHHSNIEKMLDLLKVAPLSMQAEIWSVFVIIVRKSFRNMEACSRVGLISICLNKLPEADQVVSDLLVQLLSVLTNYSITVKETKHFLRALRVSNNVWHRNSSKLLSVMQEMPKRDGADVFFSFPGKAGAGLSLPPIAKWPYQNGWTFSTWLRMDPLNSLNFEKERPFLFSFLTSKGLGYQCSFLGNCLVLHCLRGPGKEVTKCIMRELTPRKWHHVTMSFVYSRWARSEVHCYIDGCKLDPIDVTWFVNTNDHFDKCTIGCGPEADQNQAFCGQLGAVYVFSQAMTEQQANCLYCLGAAYQSYFKHDAESDLPEGYKKHLFDGRLNSSLVLAYCPKNCHGQLCLFPTMKSTNPFFVQVPHAIMKDGVEVITTHSIHNSLHSVGGIQMLLPLFAQIDMPHRDRDPPLNYDISSSLLSVISLLLRTSPSAQQQLFHSQGFLIIAHALKVAAREHLTLSVLEAFIDISKFLLTTCTGIPLLKQLFDNVLFNPALWIRTDSDVQIRLYSYLANEFFCNANFLNIVRRTQTVVELMNSLKVYYYMVEPKPPSTYLIRSKEEHDRIEQNALIEIRRHILQLVNKLVFLKNANHEEKDIVRDDEFQCLFNFIGAVNEDDNLYDVLNLIMVQMHDHPAVMVPSFDKKKGSAVIFKLLGSSNELIRIPALKILGYFICQSTPKRKTEAITNKHLLTLLSDRLLSNTRTISLASYNVLFEMLVERMSKEVVFVKHDDFKPDMIRYENPVLLKVIANLLTQSEDTTDVMKIKEIFLEDMIMYCKDSRENRRLILQMSVWQEWLISLAYVFPTTPEQEVITNLVYKLFSILLFHAIRIEYAGWRVWVDTLAIVHSKVSWEAYRRRVKASKERKAAIAAGIIDDSVERQQSPVVEEEPSSLYRTPEFVWSEMHIRLLSDLLSAIEAVVEEWNESTVPIVDMVNNGENAIFVSNTVHVMSQLTDSLIMACGGSLPLLAAATSPYSELEITDSTHQELSVDTAAHFLSRFALLADVFIFVSGVSFSELEHEKNMPNGGILRQALRLVATMAVRNILACRVAQKNYSHKIPDTTKSAIDQFVEGVFDEKDASKGIVDFDRLLQEVDIQRLKGIVYRDMEESRQAQFLALSVVYLLCVLMVSRYRDILEPPTSPSPFFDTNSDSSANKKSITPSPSSQKDSPTGSTVHSGSPKTNGGIESSPEHTQVSYIDKHPKDLAEQSPEESQTLETQEEKKVDISAINCSSSAELSQANNDGSYDANELNRFNAANNLPRMRSNSECLTKKLQAAMESVAPLLREIISDFKSFLQKTLLGSKSQELMNDNKVLQTLRNQQGSVIELVMLLCSQEWQTSLQRHAGLAFIELVNEGRLMAHATRDHVLRVANEADFILNRIRAEDVSKHASFDHESLDQLNMRKQEDQVSDHLILSSRRRDSLTAAKSLEKMRTILMSPSGAWSTNDEEHQIFWKLDLWEDDSRRRKRFVPNVYGCRHSMASLTATPETPEETEDLEKAQEQLLKDLTHKMLISQPKASATINDLVDESDIDKWAVEEAEMREFRQERTSYSTSGKLIAPGVVVPGTISITSTDVYFDADEDDPLYKQQDAKSLAYCDNLHGRWHFQEIRAIFLRRYMLQYTALELFLASRSAIMFAFTDQNTVKQVVDHLPRVGVGIKYGLPQSRKASLMLPRQLFKHSDMPAKWQRREISNFDYLMFLNTIAGRTFNDLNQYPIFPWVLANYSAEKLDLSEASNFRDLSKPVGALSESRKKHFQERFSNWEDESIPPFHYGTHYSTQAFTLNWLFRVEPFTTYFLHLQDGKFDHSDRLFHSMNEAWEHCQRDTHDVKELIPELYYLPEMFYNNNNYELGKRNDGSNVGDVMLPPWARSPEEFVMIHRQALESDLVSCQLNQWIDLIFGYKQRGPEAVRATNVFYYLTYEGTLNLNAIDNPHIREGLEQQILNFGQTPVQLMTDPHPPRHSIMTMSPLMFQPCHDDLCMLMKFISNSAIVHISANTYPQLAQPIVLSIAQNLVFGLNRWNSSYVQSNNQNTALGSSITDRNQNPGAEYPVTVDPLLAFGNPSQPIAKRHLGDAFDQRLQISWKNFVTTVDCNIIIACGYPDYSFRVIETENATVKQVVYGHGDVVTCLARSETGLFSDCYIASGSLDCTVVLWHFSQHHQAIAGEYNIAGEPPAPRAILTGHDSEITAIHVSAEHGNVISGSRDGTVLMHTTQGDLLRRIVCIDLTLGGKLRAPPVTNILMSRDCNIVIFYGNEYLATFTGTGKQLNKPAHKSVEKILCATLSRDGEYIVLGTENGRISVVRLYPLEMLQTFPQTDSPTRCVAISSNQRFVLGGLESGAIVIFNVDFNKWHYEYRQRYTHR